MKLDNLFRARGRSPAVHTRIGCGARPGVPARGLAAADAQCALVLTTRHRGRPGPGRRRARVSGQRWGWAQRDRAAVGAWNDRRAPPIQTGWFGRNTPCCWVSDVTVSIWIFQLTWAQAIYNQQMFRMKGLLSLHGTEKEIEDGRKMEGLWRWVTGEPGEGLLLPEFLPSIRAALWLPSLQRALSSETSQECTAEHGYVQWGPPTTWEADKAESIISILHIKKWGWEWFRNFLAHALPAIP